MFYTIHNLLVSRENARDVSVLLWCVFCFGVVECLSLCCCENSINKSLKKKRSSLQRHVEKRTTKEPPKCSLSCVLHKSKSYTKYIYNEHTPTVSLEVEKKVL